MAEIHLKKVGTGAAKAGKVKSAKEKHPEEYFVNWEQVSNMTGHEKSILARHLFMLAEVYQIRAQRSLQYNAGMILSWKSLLGIRNTSRNHRLNTAQCARIT